MTAILDAVRQQLGPETIQQLSGALGADPAATSNAVSLALPALLGGLAHNASQPGGATARDNALNQHDGSILDKVGGMLGGNGAGGGALGGIGGAILGHIFGGRRGSVEEGVGKASGLNAAQIAQLMAMLAPIVMGVLGRMKQTKGLDANRLPEVLNDGGGSLGGGLGSILGGMFGQKTLTFTPARAGTRPLKPGRTSLQDACHLEPHFGRDQSCSLDDARGCPATGLTWNVVHDEH